jgi:hypothetical protein
MRVSRLGVALSLVYVLPAIACVAMAIFTGDPKSSFVILQIPIVLQLAALAALGMGSWLTSLSWTGAYLLLGLPVALMLYLCGYWLGQVFTRVLRR